METKPVIVTLTGIRPDFIRMSEVFKRFDKEFNHILVHSGQHYDAMLSDVFFNEFELRKPDYNLEVGGEGKEHFHQTADLTVKFITLLREKNIKPQWIVFLGDSNTVSIAPSLRKEGYRIAHIEAGMRSYDHNMLEETNRVVCDHCSDLLFVYHENYKNKLIKEGISDSKIHVVGNTIKEVVSKRYAELKGTPSAFSGILVDIHRPENFKNKKRLSAIVDFCSTLGKKHEQSVEWINFPRTEKYLDQFGIVLPENIKKIPLMSFKEYTKKVYDAWLLVSDSGTAQEEAPMLKTRLVVPREFTERPESYYFSASQYLSLFHPHTRELREYVSQKKIKKIDTRWLGRGHTADDITEILKKNTK